MTGVGRTPRLDASFFFGHGWPYLLVPFIPIAIALDVAGASDALVFGASAFGIVPPAALMGQATEELAARSGPGIGGLLNVTFGNAPELIIALFALGEGLHEVVKATLIGSIIGNTLLVLGAAMLVGGFGRREQTFSPTSASVQTSMLLAATAAFAMPTIYELIRGDGPLTLQLVRGGPLRADRGGADPGLSRRARLLAADASRHLQPRLRAGRHLGVVDAHRGRNAGDRGCRRRRDVRGPGRLDQRGVRIAGAVGVLHRRRRGGDRWKRGGALGGGDRRSQGQDGPLSEHRDRLERPGRALRCPGARPRRILHRPGPAAAGLQRLRDRRARDRRTDRELRDPRGQVELVRGCTAPRRIRHPRDRLRLRLGPADLRAGSPGRIAF